MNRRTFLQASGASALGAVASVSAQTGRVLGANDRIRCGFIGLGGMGRSNLGDFLKCPGVEVVALCDVWEHNLKRAAVMVATPAAQYADFRKLIDRSDIDVVVVSSPDHWHAYQTIQSCKAGKDVYVEKPLSLTVSEGRKMVDAAREHRRVVQVGTQQRSGRHYHSAAELVQSGKLGKITQVAAWNFENHTPNGIGNFRDSEPPPGLDYDMWLGPAPKRAFNPNRFIYTFRFFWDYAGGHATDWGVHHVDSVQWMMGVKAPKKVTAVGGKYCLQDNRETPDTLEVIYEYPNFVLTYSNRLANAGPMYNRWFGIAFYGSNGTLVLDRNGYEVLPETGGATAPPQPAYLREMEAMKPAAEGALASYGARVGRTETIVGGPSEQHLSHVQNFLACLRSRQKPASDIEDVHRATTATQLANISLWTGRTIHWDSSRESIVNDADAAKHLSRQAREPWALG